MINCSLISSAVSPVTEDWLKLTDFDPDNVIRLGPVRPRKGEAAKTAMV